MPSQYLLGIDIGTYESKGVITTASGQVVASAAEGHGMSLPQPGWAEHDADAVWWRDFVTLCRRMLEQSGLRPEDIAGVGVSAIAQCVLPIDRAGRPLRPGILYGIDTRATAEVVELEARFGRDAIFAVAASHLSAQDLGPRALWLQKNEPGVWAETDCVLTASSYVVYRLTGEKTIDVYTATASAPMLDVRRVEWSEAMTTPIMPLDKLPRLAWSGEVVGRVTAAAAAETGLAEGTPVVAGTADAAAEALSTGLAQTGDLMIMYGSSTFFIQKTDRLVTSEVLWGARFLQEGTYVVAAGTTTGGSITRWFRDQFAPGELAAEAAGGPNAYAALAELAASAPLGANGLLALPYFYGERTPIHDPNARGLIAGLTLSHTRADVYRALLEAVGYSVRHNIEAMAAAGVPPRRCLAVGGGTRNRPWMQLVSDIAGVEQYLPDQHLGACYGDAFLAGQGVGFVHDIAQVAEWVRHKEIVQPDPEAYRRYDEFYALYLQLYRDTAETVHRLARVGKAEG